MLIKDSNGQNTGFNLEGDDWDVKNSKFTTIDLINSVFNYKNITQSVHTARQLMKGHYAKMKSGDIRAILAFTLTTILLTTISLAFFSCFSNIGGKSKSHSPKTNDSKTKTKTKTSKEEEEEEKEPPRDYTIEQLRKFDGTNNQPIYISLLCEVFDVTQASGFYGPGSG